MFEQTVRQVVKAGRTHKWLRPLGLLALLALFGGAALWEGAGRLCARTREAALRASAALLELRRDYMEQRERGKEKAGAAKPVRSPYRPARRAAAGALAACLLLTLLPVSALAEGGAKDPEPVTVTAFDALEETVAVQTVPYGTAREVLNLPDTLRATVTTTAPDTAPAVLEGVVWEPDRAYEGAAGGYAFTASAEGYVCADGVDWPVITVTMEKAEPDEVDALCAAIDALPTVEELYENAPGDADPEFDDWVTEISSKLAEVPALWAQFLALSEDAASMERITEARADKLAGLHQLVKKLAERRTLEENIVPNLDDSNPSDKILYANGVPLLLVAGSSDTTKTVVYIDKGALGQLDNEDVIFDPDGNGTTYDGTIAGNDLSKVAIFGGSPNQTVASTNITMTGGKVSSIYGGGYAKTARATANVTDSTNVKISGGTVRFTVYAGGQAASNSTAEVGGNTKLEITGGRIDRQVWGGGVAKGTTTSTKVGGSSTVSISGQATIGEHVFGGGYAANISNASNVTSDVAGSATVSISGNAKVHGSVYQSGSLAYNNGYNDISDNNNNSATVGTDSSVTISGGVTIGNAKANGDPEGIFINGGTGPVATGVESFVIDPDLTGADGSVNVQLPAGYDITSNPTIATGAVEADLAKINLVGNGATGKEAYFENNEIKVREKPAAPVPTVVGQMIFANGAELKIVAGETEGYTNILYDKNNDHTIGNTEYLKIGTAEPTAAGYDLSSYFIYGGSQDADVDGATKITMTGGKVHYIYGGGIAAKNTSANVTGDAKLKITGGQVTNIFGGGNATENASANVTGDAKLEITGGEIGGWVYGGGMARGGYSSAAVQGSSTVAISGTAVIKKHVLGGGYANNYNSVSNVKSDVTGAATVTISGNAEVQGNVYQSGNLSDGDSNLTAVSDTNGNSATVGAGSSIIIGDSVKIGGAAKGIVINGGTDPVATGVESFVIDPDLTGADASVNVVLPAGYDVSTTPTIATGAVEADLAKINLVGSGAEGKEAYFESNGIKVRAKSSDAKQITGFTIPGHVNPTTINHINHTIAVLMPAGTNVTSLTPTITVSEKASVSPASQTPQNFTSPVAYTVTAEDGTAQIYTVTVTVAPTITTQTLPGGTVGTAYSQTLAADGTAPVVWSVSEGSLPDGLNLNPGTGVISGTPTTAGTSTVTVKAENRAGNDTRQLSIQIDAPAPTYGISLSQTGTYTFAEATVGYGDQTPLTVTVTNAGNQPTGSLNVQIIGEGRAAFAQSTAGIDSIAAGGTATFTVQPATGLSADTYTATVQVSGSSISTAQFDVSFTVTEQPVTRYTLTVIGSYASATGEGSYSAGETVTIHAGSRSEYSFSGWTGPNSISFANANSATTTFPMSADNVTVTAHWTYTGGGSSSGGGSSDSSHTTTEKNPDGSTTTTVTKPDGTVTETTKAPDGTKTVVETKKDGTKTETVETPDGVKAETITTPQGDQTYTEQRPDGTKISADAPKSGEATATVALPESVGETVVSFPATDGTVVLRVLPDGTEEPVPFSLVEDGRVYVRLDADAELKVETRAGLFDDMDGHWAEESADFTGARALFEGTAPRNFAPDQVMTRAMLATVLYRMDGKPQVGEAVFDDVDAAAWYAPGAAWASEHGIAAGNGGAFGGERAISRQELAVMLWNYAKYDGLDVSVAGDSLTYSDMDKAAEWAVPALHWACGMGILQGDQDGALDPTGTATRAEVAAMLERFVIAVVQ